MLEKLSQLNVVSSDYVNVRLKKNSIKTPKVVQ